MFRFIHTADWHLGQSFYGYDRDFEHGRFLEWLLAKLIERQPDALLIAGDVFDTVNPAATALRRFYEFLARVHTAMPSLQVVLTAGNHDAAARLEAPAELFQNLNITAVGTVARDAAGQVRYGKFLVPLRSVEGCVVAIAVAVPFLRPSDVPELPGANDAYLDGVREMYRQAAEAAREMRDGQFPGAALVALGHCHLQGGAESRDSERRLIIGGAEGLKPDIFPVEFAYVALGHLHKPQKFEGGRIQYSGSPIPLSFSELEYAHRVVEVELAATGISFTTHAIPKTAALVCVPTRSAPLAEVLRLLAEFPAAENLPADEWPFLEVRVLDDGPDPLRRLRIEQALAGKAARLASIKLALPEREAAVASPQAEPSLADLASMDPLDLLCVAHRDRYATEPDAELLTAFREILAMEGTRA